MTDGYVKKNAWWYAECSKHGRTPHLGVLDGKCEECAKENCANPDLVDADHEPPPNFTDYPITGFSRLKND